MKKISSFFPAETRDQKEMRLLKQDQDLRNKREELAHIRHRAAEIIQIMDHEDVIPSIADVGDVAVEALTQMAQELPVNFDIVQTSVEQARGTKRKKSVRPENWKEIADYHESFGRKTSSTMRQFNLEGGVEFWRKTFSRWSRYIKEDRHVSVTGRRTTVIGADIDDACCCFRSA